MSQTNEEVKQDFDHLCKEITFGIATKENIRIITKTMCDTKQHKYMRQEFCRLSRLLESK